ncbi:MAG: putative ABC transporter permease subunit [Candidatus Freyarchaeota archaeon]
MRRRIVWEIISLEFRLFFRSGYRQNQAATIVTLIFFNASFGIWMSLGSIGVSLAVQAGVLTVESIFNFLLLVFNGLLILLLLFNTLSFLAICSREEDVELLVPLPVTTAEVVAGKMVWNFLVILFYVFIPLCGLMAPVGLVLGVGVASAAFAAAILVLVASSGLAGLLGSLSLRLFKPAKMRERLLVIVSISSILGIFIFQFAFSRVFSGLPDLLRHFSLENPLWYISPATWAALFSWGLYRGAVTYAIMPIVGLLAMAFGICFFSFKYAVKTYYSILTEVRVAPRLLTPSAGRVGYPLSFLRSVLGDAGYSIFLNEVRMTRRDMYRLMQIVMLIVVVAVMFIPHVSSASSMPLQASGFLLGMTGLLIPFMVGTIAIQCFGFEGDAFQLLKSAPVRGKQIVLGKFAFYLIVSVVELVIFLPALSVILPISPASLLTVLFSSILGCIGVLGFSMYIGVSWPDFEKVVTGLFGSQRRGVSMLGTLVYIVVVMLIYFGPNIAVFAASSFLNLPIALTLIPATIMLAIGFVALGASFKKVEELEVA